MRPLAILFFLPLFFPFVLFKLIAFFISDNIRQLPPGWEKFLDNGQTTIASSFFSGAGGKAWCRVAKAKPKVPEKIGHSWNKTGVRAP